MKEYSQNQCLNALSMGSHVKIETLPHPQPSLSSLKPGCLSESRSGTICHFSKALTRATTQIRLWRRACEKDLPTAAATQLLTYPVVQGGCTLQHSLKTFKCLEVNWTSQKLLNSEERKKMLRLKKKEESKLRYLKQKGESKQESIMRTWWDDSPTSNFWEALAYHFN